MKLACSVALTASPDLLFATVVHGWRQHNRWLNRYSETEDVG